MIRGRPAIALAVWGLLATALLAPLPAAAAGTSIDQTPILRVLRTSDVPGSGNLELPSGALGLSQFVSVDGGTAAVRAAEKAALRGGFLSSAISEFGGPGDRLLRSTAVEFTTASLAKRAMQGQARVFAKVAVPAGSSASSEPVRALPSGLAIAYRAGNEAPNAVVVMARSGAWLFTLRGTGDHGGTNVAFLGPLLAQVIARQ